MPGGVGAGARLEQDVGEVGRLPGVERARADAVRGDEIGRHPVPEFPADGASAAPRPAGHDLSGLRRRHRLRRPVAPPGHPGWGIGSEKPARECFRGMAKPTSRSGGARGARGQARTRMRAGGSRVWACRAGPGALWPLPGERPHPGASPVRSRNSLPPHSEFTRLPMKKGLLSQPLNFMACPRRFERLIFGSAGRRSIQAELRAHSVRSYGRRTGKMIPSGGANVQRKNGSAVQLRRALGLS